ncbi:disease resistance protein RPM1-like [Lotus japonicus]|uniref:disease resistance protein RPM1-like n=1 Tax=Lotus japonicus TaxID=34305 RepID=UPI002586CE43|nr:disease resistance protein RPM1-like [Lotus japonicus]
MCDLALSFARHILLPMADLANLIKGLPEEVQKMKDELEKIQTFIYETDRMSATEVDKESVKQLVERAFRLEDTIDEYMICEQWQPAHDLPFAALPSEAASFIKTMSLRVQMACKIKFFKWLQRSEKDDGLQVSSSSEQGPSTGHQDDAVRRFKDAALLLNEVDVVGFESPKKTLIDWLVNGREERTVISVVGMGGQGKTTVSKQVFNDKKATGPYRAWVTVSQSYTVDGILRDMLQAFYKEQRQSPPSAISTMDRVSLITEARNYLQEKRYIVFFDDVWNTHFWDDVEHALIDNKLGSRVFITTRDGDVINFCKKSSFIEVLELQPLTKKKSLKLFCKKAFFDLNENCPPNLVKICSEIVNKCNGLPLAIVAMGGVLAAKKRDVFVWEDFSKYLSSELEKDPSLNGIRKILGISYDDLPPSLKPCLLYFGMYPEDYEVRSKRVIRKWIAEGFVKGEKGESLEKVAEGYLSQLIHRNLVQVSSFTGAGRVKGCRVHDLLRDMILKKFEDLSFCQFIPEDDKSALSVKSRRLSIETSFNDFMVSTESSYIRSLLFFIEEAFPMGIIPTKYKLLKVLDFEDVGFYCGAPENLGTLIHLRYLSFRNTGIKSLPESIGKLENLETLDLRGTYVEVLPKEIGKLRKLRHFLYTLGVSFTALKDSVGGMTSLQTLRGVSLSDDEALELIIELEKLRQLRVLGLYEAREEHEGALCSLFNKMQHLEKLYISIRFGESIDLNSTSMPMLRVLQLQGMLHNFPEWTTVLQNLVKLTMVNSSLTVDTFKSLQNMPNLLFLSISDSYDGDTLHVHDGGFPNLKHLQLEFFSELEFFHIDKGALPSLETLTLRGFPMLNKVPRDFQHLKNLRRLDMLFCSTTIEDCQQGQIIEYVPRVQVHDYDLDDNLLIHRLKFGKEGNRISHQQYE